VRVVLRNNAIFVQGSANTLEESWMEEFFDHHIQNTLFLDNGVLVLNNENSSDQKEEFLETLSERYTKMNELTGSFLQPITQSDAKRLPCVSKCRIEKVKTSTSKCMRYGPDRVKLTFLIRIAWVMRYLKQQLSSLVTQFDIHELFLSM
jgi:hypothetical protein